MSGGEIVRLEIPSSTKYISVVRQTVEGVALRLPLATDDIEDVKLAVGEACANAIKHGANNNAPVTICCCISHRGLEIEICNAVGNSACTPAFKDLPDPSCLSEGGLGLYLMKRLMDEVEMFWEDGLVTVKMLKRVMQAKVCREP